MQVNINIGEIDASLGDGPPAGAADLLRSMLRIRFFEDEVMALFNDGLMRGSTHLCQGQEAVAVGVASHLRRGDAMLCTYRGHGAVLAMGASLNASFAELLGRKTGLCGGKGGSMHFTDVAVGALGANAIVGAHLPIAVGAALSADLLKTESVAVAFCGDGATNIGAFHESLNLASVWRLPVIFVIENNHYGEYSPLARTTPLTRLAERAGSYHMRAIYVDGNDIVSVRAAAHQAVEAARSGGGPTLIEADTYRFSGHSRSDPAKYRPDGELESWQARDPIELLAAAMVSAGTSLDEIERYRRSERSRVSAALVTALAAPEPDPAVLYEDVFA